MEAGVFSLAAFSLTVLTPQHERIREGVSPPGLTNGHFKSTTTANPFSHFQQLRCTFVHPKLLQSEHASVINL